MVDSDKNISFKITITKKPKRIVPCSLTTKEVEEIMELNTCLLCGHDIMAHRKDIEFISEGIDEKDLKYYQKFKNFYEINSLKEDVVKLLFKSIIVNLKSQYDEFKYFIDNDFQYDCRILKNRAITTMFSKTRNLVFQKNKICIDRYIAPGKDWTQIYKAYHEGINKLVALKLYPYKNSATIEFNNALLLTDSEYVVHPIEIITVEHPSYLGLSTNGIVMPYLPVIATDFLQFDSCSPSIPEELTLKIINSMIEVAYMLNQKSMVFCDFKLQNVGITVDGEAKIFDFGAIVKIGNLVLEYTEMYSLDFNDMYSTANEKLDMICIAMSAAICADSEVLEKRKINSIDCLTQIAERVAETDHIGWRIAKIIVDCKLNLKESYDSIKKLVLKN